MKSVPPVENGILINCFKFGVHRLFISRVINEIDQIFNPNPNPNISSNYTT